MLITVQSDASTALSALPDDARGAYWIKDAAQRKVAFAEAEDGAWLVRPARGMRLTSGGSEGQVLIPRAEARIFALEDDADAWLVICRPSTKGDKTTRILGFAKDLELPIGRAADNAIIYPSQYISSHHATLSFAQGAFSLLDHGSSNGVFLNGRRVTQGVPTGLNIGDVVTILGLHITVGDRLISLNDPESTLAVKGMPGLVPFRAKRVTPDNQGAEIERPCFYPALRFARSIEPKNFVVDAPPPSEAEDDTPIAMRIGPSLAMVMASITSAAVSMTFMMGQGGSAVRAVPMLVMALAMFAGSVLWPVLNRRFQHERHEQREARRRSAYAQYLGKMRSELQREARLQRAILEENRLSPRTCLAIAQNQDEQLMARMPLHKDYLELRLGRGDVPLEANIRFPDIRFETQEDDLRDALVAFAQEPQRLTDVPLGHSLIESPAMGIVGSADFTDGFLRNLIIQICALHSYANVKVVILGDEESAHRWSFAKHLPHLFADNKVMRFYAVSLEEACALGMSLERILESRLAAQSFDAREAKPYLVLVCPSKAVYDKVQVVKDVLSLKDNLGFTVIACARSMHELPAQCRVIVGEGAEGEAFLLDRKDPTGTRKSFRPDDPVSLEDAKRFALDVASARLDVSEGSEQWPDRLSFLQMFGVGNVEHLNIVDRWRNHNASDSLAACIGVDAAGDAFVLDLHEDFHGPHGLIAGTTGSGKSEFIITYVLSMALNYSPDDVAFVLIDYKGGGLAKAFDNDRFRLPHIAGTITNLDGSAISRSLASLRSELRRRQRLFNEAREVQGGDNVDIYKYLDLYRQGRVSEPCPHLIVIADEFAELKQQEPEFMDELISASRIGRSLGVHLILATQKPSGVVNDQIWSNARFKVALKVADAADSHEIIKRPEAAEITQPGRFFLLVGYNESFGKGQSGYAGSPYRPQASADAPQDQAVSFISNTGRVLLSVKPQAMAAKDAEKTQIVAVSEHIVQVAADQGKQAQRLWLPPIPPSLIMDVIVQRFGWTGTDDFALSTVIGIYDDPANQQQGLLTLPLLDEGNAIIYGSADAGAEQVVRALLLSALMQHSARTLHAYVLDFGSQSLTAFAGAPQVGDVVLLGDDEKVKRFFPFMVSLIEERRALFAPHGGSFARYCEKTEGCPLVLVVLNGMAAFLDTYPEHEEALISFAREAAQAGICLVVVGETPNAVRMRLKSHFRQILACDLPDPADYGMLFGSLQGMAAPHGYGRGLIKKDDAIYEFQAARACPEDESEYDFIVDACAKLSVTHGGQDWCAPAIPLPPKCVEPSLLAAAPVSSGTVPYGVFDDTLALATFDLTETALARCVYLKSKTGEGFATALIRSLTRRGTHQVMVLDMAKMLARQPEDCAFATRRDECALQCLCQIAEQGAPASTVILISGIAGFFGRCSPDASAALKDHLKSLQPGGGISVILMDAVNDASYTYDDWFKAHLTHRDGLWVGPGIESQSAINITYNGKLLPDSKMGANLGYYVEGGLTRLVHLATPEERRNIDRGTEVLATGVSGVIERKFQEDALDRSCVAC